MIKAKPSANLKYPEYLKIHIDVIEVSQKICLQEPNASNF